MRKRVLTLMMVAVMLVLAGTLEGFAASGTPTVWSVTGAKATSGYNKVTLTWNQVSNADGYIIRWVSKKGVKGCYGTKMAYGRNNRTWKHTLPVDCRDVNTTYVVRAVKLDKNKKILAESKQPCTVVSSPIRLLNFQITFDEDRYDLYCHCHDPRVGGRFSEGTTVATNGFNGGRYIFNRDGHTWYVSRISTRNRKVYKIDTSKQYSWDEAQKLVNSIGISSDTDMLIWVNQYTQKEYIFRGSQGHWVHAAGPWEIASGSPSTPTDTGTTRIRQKVRSDGPPYWNVCSVFSIHGNLPNYWGDLGWPKSGACVRNTNSHAGWIYYNCPIGTRVFIY